MDIQKKKNKMIDILPSEEGEQKIILSKKLPLKNEIIKPIIHLADIAKKEEIKEQVQPEEIKNLDKLPIIKQDLTNAISTIETMEIGKESKTIDFTEKIFKKEKEEPLLLQNKNNFNFKKYIIYFFIILTIALSLFVAIYILPRAEIIITTKKSSWNFNDNVEASKDISNVNLTSKQIPAEIFKDIKTLTLSFAASGKKYVERKAVGEITIYNSYSSQSQTLIAGTRIESPNGKIFRLDKKIVVPGAKIEEGKIAASNLKTTITAEKAGEEYNIAPVDKFTIPGFKGTSKYNGFYAVSNETMTGGLIGDILFPTEEDIIAARKKTSEQLSNNIDSFLLSQFNNDFKIFEWGKFFNITKENIDKEADKNGDFLVSLEGELKIIAFKESDILKLISETAKQTLGPSFEIKKYDLSYGTGQFNSANGKMSVKIEFNGEFWEPISAEIIKNSVINKKESDLKIFVFSLPGIEKATFSLWPGWVRTVPNSIEKVKIAIN